MAADENEMGNIIVFDPRAEEIDISRISPEIASEMVGHPVIDVVDEILENFDYYLEVYPNVFELTRYKNLLYNVNFEDIERRYDILNGVDTELTQDEWILFCAEGIIHMNDISKPVPLYLLASLGELDISYPKKIHCSKRACITEDAIHLCFKAKEYDPTTIIRAVRYLESCYQREVALQYEPDIVFDIIIDLITKKDILDHIGIDSNLMTIVNPNIDYLLDSYMGYLIRRKTQIKKQFPLDYSDREIFHKLGLRFLYRSRSELINIVNDLFLSNTNHTFLLDRLDNIKPRNHLLSFTLENLEVSTSQLIGWGNLDNCFVTSFDDLTESLQCCIDSHKLQMCSPETGQPLNEDIIRILKRYGKILNQNKFLQKLDELDKCKIMRHADDHIILTHYTTLSSEEQSYIMQFMLSVFYAGMYMRRWEKDSPYPLKKEETKITGNPDSEIESEFIPESPLSFYTESDPYTMAKVAKHIQLLNENFNLASDNVKTLIKIIPQCEISQGQCKIYNLHFWSNIAHQVNIGKECFRIASTYFIGTSYRFFVIINDIPPELRSCDVLSIESIL